MEEENEDHHHHHKNNHHQPRIKTLNFHAPLLSRRRPAKLPAIDLSSCLGGDDDDGIPFSWEKAPGKPKETAANGGDENDTPRPKLPPSMWQCRHVIVPAPTVDVSCDASNAVGVTEDEGEDVFSLSEAIDIAERSEKRAGGEGLRLKIIEDRSRADGGFLDFIIQRFLSDAAALAAASLREAPARREFSPAKGCGLESVLFPWRSGGNRLCGVRSPDVVVDHRRGDWRHKDKRSW